MRFAMFVAAFCGFAIAVLGWVAFGFHQMDAGVLDILTAVAAVVVGGLLWDYIRDMDELYQPISDEEFDLRFPSV